MLFMAHQDIDQTPKYFMFKYVDLKSSSNCLNLKFQEISTGENKTDKLFKFHLKLRKPNKFADGKLNPRLHPKDHGQQVEGGDSAFLLCSCQTPPGALCTVLVSPA